MTSKMKIFIFALSFTLLIFDVRSLSLAQTTSATPSEVDTLDVPKARKFVYLTLGIEYDEKLLQMPEVISFKGDFKRVTSATYSRNSQSIRFTPKAEGIATLQVMDKNTKKIAEFRIIVRKSRLDAVAREIQSLLGDVEGVTVKILNNKVIVDGQVLLPQDMARVINVVGQFGDQASSLVVMSPLALKKIAEYIARDINNPEIEVKALNDKIILSGYANNEGERASAEKIAQFYMPPVVAENGPAKDVVLRRKPANDGIVNLISVKPAQPPPPPKMVQVVLHYVELSKDYSKSFRFQFMPSIDDGSGVTVQAGDAGAGATTQFTATINSLFPKLNWLKTHGHARSLESGTIIVKEGEKGTFSSTTEMPKSVVQGGAGQVAQTGGEKVGIQTAITPTLTGERSDSVDLDIQFHIAAPNGTTASGVIVSSNDITSKIVVRSTQSAAIGGLISNNTTTAYNRLPAGVSSNPIISLYASKDFNRGQSQFIVFITPIIRSSASVGAEKLKKKFRLRE